jgi:hypothetical protein
VLLAEPGILADGGGNVPFCGEPRETDAFLSFRHVDDLDRRRTGLFAFGGNGGQYS